MKPNTDGHSETAANIRGNGQCAVANSSYNYLVVWLTATVAFQRSLIIRRVMNLSIRFPSCLKPTSTSTSQGYTAYLFASQSVSVINCPIAQDFARHHPRRTLVRPIGMIPILSGDKRQCSYKVRIDRPNLSVFYCIAL